MHATERHIHTGARFLTDFAEQSESDELIIPEDLSTLSREDLDALADQATAAFEGVYGDGTDLSVEDMDTLAELAESVEALRSEQGVRDEADAERAAQAAELAARVRPETELSGDTETDGDEDADEDPDADGDTDDEGAPAGDADEADGDGSADTVTAGAGRKEVRVKLGQLRSRQSRAATQKADGPSPLMTASPQAQGLAGGQSVDFMDMAKALDKRLAGYNGASYAAAAKRSTALREQFGLGVLHRPTPEGLIIKNGDASEVERVFNHAADENRLKGGSLVAAGGWCAPSEILYDFCELESNDGMVSVPEVQINRGGIQFTLGPDFSTIFENTGFCYTEQEDIDGDYDGEGGGSKPCFKVDCPPFKEERLQLCGLCITAGLLQQRGYPEVIARTIRGALVAHNHRVNGRVIAEMVAGSDAVSMPSPQAGAIAPLLDSIEKQVEHYRYTHRLARGRTLEAVFPFWVRATVRADLSRRLGVELLSVPDSRIDGWFRERGINPQFVYDWQDLTGTADSFTAWPTTVTFLLYTSGTWIKGVSDIITIDNVYDSTLRGTNDYTALFTEEGYLVAKRCHDSRVVTVPICPDGVTHGGIDIDCNGTPVAAG